jgi:hypothetical protein
VRIGELIELYGSVFVSVLLGTKLDSYSFLDTSGFIRLRCTSLYVIPEIKRKEKLLVAVSREALTCAVLVTSIGILVIPTRTRKTCLFKLKIHLIPQINKTSIVVKSYGLYTNIFSVVVRVYLSNKVLFSVLLIKNIKIVQKIT